MNWQNDLPLKTDEIVLWEGTPVVSRRALRCAPLTAMGVCLFCLLAKVVLSDPGTWREGGIWILALLALLFTSAPLLGWLEGKWTLYVLTNQRALVLMKRWGRFKVAFEFPAANFHRVEVRPGRHGSGSVVFGHFGMGAPAGFLQIPDLAAVEPHIRKLAGQAQPPASPKSEFR